MPDTKLLSVLESLRDRGALGEPSLPRAVDHADSFVAEIPTSARSLVDLGSGGGLPGLVIAVRRPDLRVVLVDRRERRMDLLRLACARLGIAERVTVLTGDVVRLAKDGTHRGMYDVVTARAFGDPIFTLECAVPFLAAGGVVIVSEPPLVDLATRWPSKVVAALGLTIRPQVTDSSPGSARVQCFDRRSPAASADERS
ncbi:MAG: rRNA small subunit methyltransferase [Acidimicrobiales bacterium]|nr:rRNA small subunit methyltransferase [Acidimicrobiales bacterium]